MNSQAKVFARAQGAIEYLLIIGAAILVVAIVIIAITSVLNQGQQQVISGDTSYSTSVDTLKEGSGNYTRVGGGYYLNTSPILNNAVGIWKLNDVTVVAPDTNAATNSLKGGTVNLSCKNTRCPKVVSGLFGSNAYSFDGVDDYMEFDSLGIDNTSFTFSVWVNIKDYAKSPPSNCNPINGCQWGYELFGYDEYQSQFLDQAGTIPNPDYDKRCGFDFGARGYAVAEVGQIGYWSDNSPVLGYGPGSSAVGMKLPKETWMLLTFVFDKSQNKATSYINGVANIGPSINQIMSPVKQCSSQKLWLGKSASNTGTFNGLMQDVSVWNRALSSDEVKELYDNSLAN